MRDPGLHSKHILIADDDPVIRAVMRAALLKDGYTVTDVENGKQALEAFIQQPPSMVFLDVEMPEMNGFDACKAMRKHTGNTNVPIVIVTGRDDVQAVNTAYEAGATDFIAKPINWPIFLHRVRYIIRTSLFYHELRLSVAKNKALLTAIPDTMFIVTADGDISEYLPGGHDHPLPRPQAEHRNVANWLPPHACNGWSEIIKSVQRTSKPEHREFSLPIAEDKHAHYEARFLPYLQQSTLVTVSEVTARKAAAERIHNLAFYDTLTGLPNRELFRQNLLNLIKHARKANSEIAILFVDLDNFKRINDTLGHTFGDGVLKAIAERLASSMRGSRGKGVDRRSALGIARLGGDEFVVAIDHFEDDGVLNSIADRLCAQLREPVCYGGHTFVVTPSIGISVYPHDGDNVEDLLKNADVAMYQAKQAGRNAVRFYSGTMSVRSLHRLELEVELRKVVEREELELYYQPKIDMSSGRLIGVEALLRWKREDGFVPPSQFIPLAEETGLIIPIGEWVQRTACRQANEWGEKYGKSPRIAINISSQQFFRSDLYKSTMQILFETGTKPSLLQFELTESILMRDIKETITTLTDLKSAGISLAIDDFGTGYSSLSYLKKFPLDALKIDRSFVNELPHNNNDAAICAAIIAMAHQLSLEVIAEGVETSEQSEYLTAQGCDQAQGYLFGKPMPAKQLAAEFLSGEAAEDSADSAG